MEEFWTYFDKGCDGSWKLDNFHGRHMCIIPKQSIEGKILQGLLTKFVIVENCKKYLTPACLHWAYFILILVLKLPTVGSRHVNSDIWKTAVSINFCWSSWFFCNLQLSRSIAIVSIVAIESAIRKIE